MGRTRVIDAQSGFAGGLNTSADESQLGPDELRVATNVLLTEYGGALKRGGSQNVHSSVLGGGGGLPIQNGYCWQTATGTPSNIVIANGKFYSFPYGTFPVTVTEEAGSTLSASNTPDLVAFRQGGSGVEVVFIADGGPLNYWDGATLTENVASTPNAKRIAVYNRRLFGITGDSQTLYWSDLDEGDTLGIVAGGGGEAVIRTFSDRKLTGLAACAGSLLLFHVSGISVFTGWTQDDINISAGSTGLTSDVGTTAPRTIVALENEVLFLSDRGFYSATPQSVTPISTTIDSEVVGLTSAQLDASFGVHFRSRREVWFYVGEVGFYVFNYRTRRWSGPMNAGYLDPISTCGWESVTDTDVPIMLVGTEPGFVKKAQAAAFLDNVLADGTGGDAYEAVLQLHRMFTESGFEATKAWRWGYILFDPRSAEDVTVEWDTQYGDDSYALPTISSAWGGGTWGAGTWGGSGVQPFRIPMSGRGQYVDVTIRDASSSGGGLYSKFSVEAFDLTRRG